MPESLIHSEVILNIKSFNKSFTTQQNFTYGVMLILYQSLSHQLADMLDKDHVDDPDLLVRGFEALSQSFLPIGIQRILEGTPRIASIRKYLTVLKTESSSESIKDALRTFRDYIVKTGVGNVEATAITQHVYNALKHSICEEGSQIIYDKVNQQFIRVPSIKLRRK